MNNFNFGSLEDFMNAMNNMQSQAAGANGQAAGAQGQRQGGRRGGKGVLCTGTLAIVMNWKIACIAFALFLLVFFLTRYVSLGSFVGVGSFAAMLILQYPDKPWVCALMGVMVVLVLFMHRGNIKRLLHGQERKTYFHRSKNEGG